MPRKQYNLLSDPKLKELIRAGACRRYPDGNSLYFHVYANSAAWEYDYRINGKRRTKGLGAYPEVSLKQARLLRDDNRAQVRDGIDPIVAANAKRQTASASLSVAQAIEASIKVKETGWKTLRYPNQIRTRMQTYVTPIIGHLPIADIGHAEILQVLSPIWHSMRPTAERIRQHLEAAINWAIQMGVRANDSNPAEIKRLDHLLSFAGRKATHYASLPYIDAPRLLTELRQKVSTAAKALELILLTGVRVGDVLGGGKAHSEPMKWAHVDLDAALWNIPDTKMGRPLQVPLSEAAVRVLQEMQRRRERDNDVIFPGAVCGTVLNDATLRILLRDMGYSGLATTHGMRATFRTWASETTGYDKGVIESALAHTQGALDAAYHRGSYLDKRAKLMTDWANFLEGREASNVVQLRYG